MVRKRLYINGIYAFSMLLIIIMRIAVSAGAFYGLSSNAIDAVWSVTVQVVIMGIIPLTLYTLYLKKCGSHTPLRQTLDEFGYRRGVSKISWLMILFAALLATFINSCVSNAWYNLLIAIGYKSPISQAVTSYSVGQLFFDIFFTACMPAVFEEFSNRGLLYEGYEHNKKAPTRVIIVTALMFALMHTSVRQVGYTFVFGLICGSMVYVTKSIWPAMLLHFINNLISVLRGYAAVNGGAMSFMITSYNWLFGTAAGVGICIILFIAAVFCLYVIMLKIGARESAGRIKKGRVYEIGECVIGRYDNLLLYFAVSLNVIVTAFTLVWGIMR